jgi:hypothetical protein
MEGFAFLNIPIMFKFFRRKRYNLMDKYSTSHEDTFAQTGKTVRYFKYAFGEVILVVIGILIALQINNWNTSRIDDIKIEKLKRTILYYYKAMDDSRYLDSIRAFVLSGQIGRKSDFNPSKSGIEALLGSGDINLISDSIRIKINEYYELNNELRITVERVTSLTRNVIQDRLLKQVVKKSFIEDFTQFKFPSEGFEAEKTFIPDSCITTDIMLLSIIVKSYVGDLLQLKSKGLELIKAIQKN